MKAPGKKPSAKRARKIETRLRRRTAVKVFCYPVTRLILLQAARMSNRSLEAFVVWASLKEAASVKGVQVEDLIPPDEYQQYR